MTRQFRSPAEAAAYLGPLLDRPVPATSVVLAPGITFSTEPLPGANSYTVSWQAPAHASVVVAEPPISVPDHARHGGAIVTSTAGFFFLADRCRYRPRTLSLNLAVHDGLILSVPVSTRDALVSRGGVLSVVEVPATGELSVAGTRLHWAGSKTGLEADCHVYGNANAVIEHRPDPHTGKVRVLHEPSRFTPAIADTRWTDLGFALGIEGRFHAVARADEGGLAIFDHDLVVRCPRSAAGAYLELHTIGPLVPEPGISAISVGPSLSHPDLGAHPLNDDRSLGSFPLLRDRPSTRLVIYETSDGQHHLRLFDGRPGSRALPGLTLDETAATVRANADVVAGCLLDSGNTSKLTIVRNGRLESYGNRHYLRWPASGEQAYTWTPDAGRPVASLITLH